MKIFLGYASEHIDAAKEVAAFLESLGHEVWFDKRSLIAGDEWNEERKAGQDAADLIVHLCSEEILTRKGVMNREIRYTLQLAEDQPFGRLFVVFIRLDGVALPPEMRRFHYIDFPNADWKEKLKASVIKAGGAEPLKIKQHNNAAQSTPVMSPHAGSGRTIEILENTDIYECQASYPTYDASGIYWEFVNAKIKNLALEGFFGAKSDFTLFCSEIRDGLKSDSSFNIIEVFRLDEIIAFRVHAYIYWSGAAHPNYYTRTVNFGGSDFSIVKIQNLVGHNEIAARKILDYCERVIDAERKSEGSEETTNFFENYKENIENVWQLISQFDFDRKGFTVNFSPYDILPFVYGSHEVFVPWRLIEEFIDDTYVPLVEKLKGAKILRPVEAPESDSNAS